MIVKFKKLSEHAVIPKYQTAGSSGFDLHAIEDVIFDPFETRIIKTGLAVELPKAGPILYEMQIRPRSGMSLKTPLRIANSPGSIDIDFRGEIGVIMTNTSAHFTSVKQGQRVAQGVIAPAVHCDIMEVEELSETERGSGGYGSTGK